MAWSQWSGEEIDGLRLGCVLVKREKQMYVGGENDAVGHWYWDERALDKFEYKLISSKTAFSNTVRIGQVKSWTSTFLDYKDMTLWKNEVWCSSTDKGGSSD